jgi:hypothetical protein
LVAKNADSAKISIRKRQKNSTPVSVKMSSSSSSSFSVQEYKKIYGECEFVKRAVARRNKHLRKMGEKAQHFPVMHLWLVLQYLVVKFIIPRSVPAPGRVQFEHCQPEPEVAEYGGRREAVAGS